MSNKKIIATLTSFPFRVPMIHQVIETILNQTVQPDKIVLYLADEQFPDRKLPQTLTEITRNVDKFEIRWCSRDIRSYKKLIPALTDFPDDIIITFDDDILYPDEIIEKLINKHKEYPDAICGYRIRHVSIRFNKVLKYKRWKRYKNKFRLSFWYGPKPKFRNLATTGGGTLFPPQSLHPEVFREEVFMNLCPTTDDLWFWAMAILNGTKIVPAGVPLNLTFIEEMQGEALLHDNVRGQGLNDKNVKKILTEYPEVRKRLLQSVGVSNFLRKKSS